MTVQEALTPDVDTIGDDLHPHSTTDLVPLTVSQSLWNAAFGPAMSALIIAVALYYLQTIDVGAMVHLLPNRPGFWLCFAAYYFIGPVSEWFIYRRLWNLPVRGLAVLLRKLVSNELLLGYSGEVYFYGWARRHARLVAAPFGTIKDVTILSALVGNALCLSTVVLAWPLLDTVSVAPRLPGLVGSAGVILLLSSAVMLLRRRLFTRSASELAWITAIHLARALGSIGLAGAMWHLLLPHVALGWWLVLAAVRQLLSRLPFVPNKDVVFAGTSAILIGGADRITAAMTLMASLLLLAHLAVGATLSAAQLAAARRR